MSDKHNISSQKLYINAIRSLYEKTDIHKHRYLGYIFDLIPYINIEYNVLCFNPYENDWEKVELMTLADFCELIEYDISHLFRLLSNYREMTFDVNQGKELFCSIVYDGLHIAQSYLFVNPNIMYRGASFDNVEILGQFCKIRTA